MTAPKGENVDQVVADWGDVLDDMAATAAELEADGFETLSCHPGDVAPVAPSHEGTERVGLDVLLPDDEYEALESRFEAGAFGDHRVYAAERGGVVYLVVAMVDADGEFAALFPAYYAVADPDVSETFAHARESGTLRVFLRRLSGDYLELTYDDPDLFAPPETGV